MSRTAPIAAFAALAIPVVLSLSPFPISRTPSVSPSPIFRTPDASLGPISHVQLAYHFAVAPTELPSLIPTAAAVVVASLAPNATFGPLTVAGGPLDV